MRFRKPSAPCPRFGALEFARRAKDPGTFLRIHKLSEETGADSVVWSGPAGEYAASIGFDPIVYYWEAGPDGRSLDLYI